MDFINTNNSIGRKLVNDNGDKSDLDSNKIPINPNNEEVITKESMEKRSDKIVKKKNVDKMKQKTERLDTSSLLKNKKNREY